MLHIEKNVPKPETNRGRPNKYPFNSMVVGDSFFVPFNDSDKDKVRVKVGVAASKAGVRLESVFSTMAVDDGIRCWMVSNSRPTDDEI